MKKIIIALTLIIGVMAMALTEAQAARLGGGGRSFGKQSPTVAQRAPMQPQGAATPAPAAPTAGAPAAAPKPPSPWRGILGGALLGLGLGALLSHLGIGGGLASMLSTILMIALLAFVAMFIYRLFTRKKEESQPAAYASGYPGTYSGGYNGTPEIGSRLEPTSYQTGSASIPAPYGVPADFDVPGFVRSAKTYFIRLQAAWDRADANDIREFTSPEMFAELKMQLGERGATPNVTDVVTLEAELLGIENIGNDQMASVQFYGSIKEAANAPAVEFAEVWNLTRPLSGSGGWVLAGIQHSS
jgi:predicted lipid-binding transport protein (Tim44 family)